MAGANKSSIIILIVIILISLSLAGAGFYLFQKEHAVNVTLNGDLEDLNGKVKILEAKLGELKNKVTLLESDLKGAQAQASALNDQLDKEKTDKKEKIAEMEGLKSDLEKQNELRSKLDNQLSKAQNNILKMQSQLNELQNKKTELETKIKELEIQVKQSRSQKPAEGVELGKIVVSPEAAAQKERTKTQAPGVEGKVLVVNKDYNFAVINLGTKDDVEIGNIFSVYNGNKYIGAIKVDRVHDSMSAASFVSTDIKDKIKEGDRVVLKAK